MCLPTLVVTQQYIERNVTVKKFQMILFDTLRFYLGITKAKKVIQDLLETLQNPTKTKPAEIYTKRCDCEKNPDDL